MHVLRNQFVNDFRGSNGTKSGRTFIKRLNRRAVRRYLKNDMKNAILDIAA